LPARQIPVAKIKTIAKRGTVICTAVEATIGASERQMAMEAMINRNARRMPTRETHNWSASVRHRHENH
jgi:hypothetical protein